MTAYRWHLKPSHESDDKANEVETGEKAGGGRGDLAETKEWPVQCTMPAESVSWHQRRNLQRSKELQHDSAYLIASAILIPMFVFIVNQF